MKFRIHAIASGIPHKFTINAASAEDARRKARRELAGCAATIQKIKRVKHAKQETR